MPCSAGFQEINGICQYVWQGVEMNAGKWFYLITIAVEGITCSLFLNTLEKKLGFK